MKAVAPEDEIIRDEGGTRAHPRRKRVVAIVATVAVIAIVFAFALPRIADYSAVLRVVGGLSWRWITVLLVASGLDIATYGPPWMAALPGLSYGQATRLTLASTALSMVVPGGAAVGVAAFLAMLRQWGLRGRSVGLAVTLTSAWNQLVILGVPIVAVAALVAEGDSNRAVEIVAVVALAIFAVIVAGLAAALSSESLARGLGDRAAGMTSSLKRIVGRAPVSWDGGAVVGLRAEALELIRRRWVALTLGTLANHFTVFVVLLASVRAVGISSAHVTFVEAFAAWALARVLGSIPLTPYGVGFVELGLTGALVAFGASNAQAVAAALIYRFLTTIPTIVLGFLAAGTSKLGRPRLG